MNAARVFPRMGLFGNPFAPHWRWMLREGHWYGGWELPLGIDHTQPAQVPALLIERGFLGRAAENLARDPRWRRVYADAVATVFVSEAFGEARRLPVASSR